MVKWNFRAIVHIGSMKESYLQCTRYIGIHEWLRTVARCSINKYMYNYVENKDNGKDGMGLNIFLAGSICSFD